jgi:hypothetical protein
MRLWILSVLSFLLPAKYMSISETKLNVTKQQPVRVLFTVPF